MLSFFDPVSDPRVDRTKLHSLKDIIGLTICAVVSGCDDWEEIEIYGERKQAFLKQFLSFSNGIPSHDTINRVFSMLNPKELRGCFINWVQSIARLTDGRIVSIDGKRMRNAGTDGKKGFIHMVSAWCSSNNNLVPGQEKTDEKSNGITAIPALPDLLVPEGAIVTIDAMGCQTDIAANIIGQGADYVLAVKENQAHLPDDVREAFQQTSQIRGSTTIEKSHGRIEKRTCKVIEDRDWICKQGQCKNLHSLMCIESERTLLPTGVKQTQQRFYISSLVAEAARFNTIIRQHRNIENSLHRSLDVTFKEDMSTKQAGNAAENFSIITKIALNLLKNNTTRKTSLKKKRFISLLDDDFLCHSVFHDI